MHMDYVKKELARICYKGRGVEKPANTARARVNHIIRKYALQTGLEIEACYGHAYREYRGWERVGGYKEGGKLLDELESHNLMEHFAAWCQNRFPID
jgi:hypothetical protein